MRRHPSKGCVANCWLDMRDGTQQRINTRWQHTMCGALIPCISSFQPEKLNVYKNDSDTSWDYTLIGETIRFTAYSTSYTSSWFHIYILIYYSIITRFLPISNRIWFLLNKQHTHTHIPIGFLRNTCITCQTQTNPKHTHTHRATHTTPIPNTPTVQQHTEH